MNAIYCTRCDQQYRPSMYAGTVQPVTVTPCTHDDGHDFRSEIARPVRQPEVDAVEARP